MITEVDTYGLNLDGERVVFIYRGKFVLSRKDRLRLEDPICLEPLKELGRMFAKSLRSDIRHTLRYVEDAPKRAARLLAHKQEIESQRKQAREVDAEIAAMMKELHKRIPKGPSPEPVHMAHDLHCGQCGRTLYDVECARCGGLVTV